MNATTYVFVELKESYQQFLVENKRLSWSYDIKIIVSITSEYTKDKGIIWNGLVPLSNTEREIVVKKEEFVLKLSCLIYSMFSVYSMNSCNPSGGNVNRFGVVVSLGIDVPVSKSVAVSWGCCSVGCKKEVRQASVLKLFGVLRPSQHYKCHVEPVSLINHTFSEKA